MAFQLVQMVQEIKKCENAGAWNACIMQVYVYIDALAFLGMPSNCQTNTRSHYIAWVDKYLKGNKEQTYQYRGKDLYGARCAILHQFSSEGDYHSKNTDTLVFGYHNGGRHVFNPSINENLVMIGIPSLVDDFISAIELFLGDIQIRVGDKNEQEILQIRMDKILGTIPIQN